MGSDGGSGGSKVRDPLKLANGSKSRDLLRVVKSSKIRDLLKVVGSKIRDLIRDLLRLWQFKNS